MTIYITHTRHGGPKSCHRSPREAVNRAVTLYSGKRAYVTQDQLGSEGKVQRHLLLSEVDTMVLTRVLRTKGLLSIGIPGRETGVEIVSMEVL